MIAFFNEPIRVLVEVNRVSSLFELRRMVIVPTINGGSD
jgi:hypothetical protein